MKTKENRKFFRVRCKVPICTQISIVKVNNKAVHTGTGNICLEDISPGGLKFLSGLNMPVSDVMIIEFKLVIEKELKAFYGYILRKEEIDKGIYRYGVMFIDDGTENEKSIKILYEFNKRGVPDKQRFCYGNVLLCLKKYRGSKVGNLNKKYTFSDKIKVKMYIHTSNDKATNSQCENILINSISSEGMEFTYDNKLPEFNDNFYDFKIYIMGREILVKGNVIKTNVFPEGLYGYTIKFNISDSQKKLIAEVLKNELEVSLINIIDKQGCFIGEYNQNQWKDANFEWWA